MAGKNVLAEARQCIVEGQACGQKLAEIFVAPKRHHHHEGPADRRIGVSSLSPVGSYLTSGIGKTRRHHET